jgi:C1A family cysteine protease
MEYNKLFLFLFLLISGVNLLLPDDTRKGFLRKYTKKGQLNLKEHFKKYKPLKLGFPYDKTKIKEIMNKYSFPEKFNYLEENKITPHIKDQQRCGCCWSDAATSALAYRYKKLGLNLDLSPQYGLSCYIQDCEKGAFNLVEAEIDLEKNGTVTEECVPFSSGDGKTVEKCPTKCKDGSELKK